MAVFYRNFFVADRTDSFYARFGVWKAVRAATYGTQLVGYIHWPVDAAYEVFSRKKRTVAKGTVY